MTNTWWDLSQEAGGKPYSTANLFASKRLNDHWTVSGSVGRSQQGSYKDDHGSATTRLTRQEDKSQTENARSFRLIHRGDDVPMGKVLSDGTMVGYFGEVFLDDPRPGQAIEVEGLCKAVLPDTLPQLGDTATVECIGVGSSKTVQAEGTNPS